MPAAPYRVSVAVTLKPSGPPRLKTLYDEKIRGSVIEKDLYRSRNMKQPLSKGLIFGGVMGPAMVATKGAFPGGHWKVEDNAEPACSGAVTEKVSGRAAVAVSRAKMPDTAKR